MDGGGAIDVEEFSLMLEIMGSAISEAQATEVIGKAKKGFAVWLKAADEANVAKCRVVWEKFDDDNSGTMDLREVNNVVKSLQDKGCKAELLTAEELTKRAKADPSGELSFDEFSTWFLEQEGLPDEFGAPTGSLGGGLGKKEKSKLSEAKEALLCAAGTALHVARCPQLRLIT